MTICNFTHYSETGHLDRALECFISCVRMGHDDDWQLVTQVELLRQREGMRVLGAES
jgi:hypothetical protein